MANEDTPSPFVLRLPALHRRQRVLAEIPKPKFTCIVCGTKFGKTLGLSILAIKTLVNARVPKQILWAAPYNGNAKVGFKYVRALIPDHLIEVNRSELSITLVHNKATIYFKGVNTDPEAVEGEAYNLVIIDEASKIKEQAIVSIRTTTTATQARIIMASTPRGKNWFYTYYKKGIDDNERSYQSFRFPTWANPMISLEEVQIAKEQLSSRNFRQYYGAEFVDDTDLFHGLHQVIRGKRIHFKKKDFQYWLAKGYSKAEVVVGCDWAQKRDYCVMIALDITQMPIECVGYMRFKDIPYQESVKYLGAFCSQFGEVDSGLHDMTGLGNPLDELVASAELPVRGLTWTNQNKRDMVSDLILAVEKGLIRLPNIQELREEFENYEVKATKSGRFTYGAGNNGHDDIVSAILMAWSAAKPHILSKFEVVRLDEIEEDFDAHNFKKEAHYLAATLEPVII